MITIFYTAHQNALTTESALKTIFSKHYNLPNAAFVKNQKGKPSLKNGKMHFSVSHTKKLFFAAVSERPVGLDSEDTTRTVEFSAIVKKYPFFQPIPVDMKGFLREWTKFESAIKLLAGSIAQDGKYIQKDDSRFWFDLREQDGHYVCVCAEAQDEIRFVRF